MDMYSKICNNRLSSNGC